MNVPDANPIEHTWAGSDTSPLGDAARIARLRRRRLEERLICAILHASSAYGLPALTASAVVWATQRTRARFVAFQALQATLFQLFSFVAVVLASGLYVIGLAGALLRGLIAYDGAQGAQVTAVLNGAMLLGLASSLILRWLLPCWGVWAAWRILRGHNYRYPLWAWLAARWCDSHGVQVERGIKPRIEPQDARASETLLAGVGHLGGLAGLSPIFAPVFWATARHRSRFLVLHLLQAALFQLLVLGVAYALLIIAWGLMAFLALLPSAPQTAALQLAGSPMLQLGAAGLLVIPVASTWTVSLIAAVRALRGQEFRYPLVGRWLIHYLEDNQPSPSPMLTLLQRIRLPRDK